MAERGTWVEPRASFLPSRKGRDFLFERSKFMASDLRSMGKEERLHRMRHSAAHIMAEAVLEIFPGAKFAIGPPIDTGFYYDFELPRPLTPDDLPVIESKMRER